MADIRMNHQMNGAAVSAWVCLLLVVVQALEKNCPIIICQPGEQYEVCTEANANGSCLPCPPGTYQPDWTGTDFPEPCRPYETCSEGAVLECLQDHSCSPERAQRCICDLSKHHYGTYPNCLEKLCSTGTKLALSGACLALPPSSPGTTKNPGIASSSPQISADPKTTRTPSTVTVRTEAKDINLSGRSAEKPQAKNDWHVLYLGVGLAVGVMLMSTMVLITIGVVVLVLKWRRHREKRNLRGDQLVLTAVCQSNFANSEDPSETGRKLLTNGASVQTVTEDASEHDSAFSEDDYLHTGCTEETTIP